MVSIVVAGPDPHEVGDRLSAAGAAVSRIDGRATRSALERAGIESSVAFVLTDPSDATAIPVANEIAAARVVVYADGALAEFARHQADLLIDPDIVPPDMLVEELLQGN